MRPKLIISAFVIICGLPVLAGLVYAILYSIGLAGLFGNGFTLVHWNEAIFEAGLLKSFIFSSWIALASMSVSIPMALYLALNFRIDLGKGWKNSMLFLPLALPPIVAGFFSFMMLGDSGLLSRFSFFLGMTDSTNAFPDLIHDPYGIGIIITHIFLITPFFTLLFLNLGKQNRLSELELLSQTLGASSWQHKIKIAVPILLKKSLPVMALYFIFMFGAYEIPLLLGSQDPRMVSILAIDKMQKFDLNDKPVSFSIAAAYSMVVLVFTGLVLSGRKEPYAS